MESFSGFENRKQESYYVTLLERLLSLLCEKVLGGPAKLRIRLLADCLRREEQVDVKNQTQTDYYKIIQDAQMFDEKMVGPERVSNQYDSIQTSPIKLTGTD